MGVALQSWGRNVFRGGTVSSGGEIESHGNGVMSKELYMAACDQIIEKLMAENPNMIWDEAYEKSADLAYDRMRENMADYDDYLRMRAKEQR